MTKAAAEAWKLIRIGSCSFVKCHMMKATAWKLMIRGSNDNAELRVKSSLLTSNCAAADAC